jgi:hypothetical protein
MTRADRVLSTPPTNTPIDTTRRRFLTVAVGASVASVGTLAVAAMPAIGIPTTESACAVDPVFDLIAEKLALEVKHNKVIDAQAETELRHGYHSKAGREANDRCADMCDVVNKLDWKLANTPPPTLAGIAAVLRFANQIEDEGNEWPETDTIGADGWHYQLRATMAAAIEAIIGKERLRAEFA